MNGVIKLFLSSTFDEKMHTRRDYFKNEISAHLNKIVGQTGANLYVYDYEVGIPNGTPMETVLNTCFKKIDTSNYFVAIIDEEYGDTEIEKKLNNNAKILKQYKNLIRQGIDNQLSVLELEIKRAFENKNIRKFFFIRKDVKNRELKLQKLIQDIKNNTPSENVNDFSEDSEILTVLEKHFIAEINDELKQYKKEQRNRNLMYANKMRYYIEGNATLNIISDYISNDCDKVLVLNGKSGSGKSTLLLNWIEQHRSDSEKNIVSCFVDIDGYTVSDVFHKFNYQISELQIEKIDDKQDEISILDSFISFTHNLSKNNKKNIIVLDGLDQINFANERKGEAAKYYWLNKTLPPNVKIIVSTTDKEVDKNKFQVHTINPYSLSKIVKNHLEKEGKELLYPDFKKLINFKNKNIDNIPALARLICSEICMKANFEELPKFLTDYSEQLEKGAGIIDLFEGFLERIADRINILPKICCYLYCSQYGLDTNVLCELIRLKSENGEEQIEHFSTLLYQDLRINVDGQMEFAHSYFKQAVEMLYMRNNQDINRYRNDIIKVLKKDKLTEETLFECAYQINILKSKDKMFELLSDIDNAEKLYNMNKILLLEYLKLANNTIGLLEKFEKHFYDDKYIVFIAYLYCEITYYEKSLDFFREILNIREQELGKDHPNIAESYQRIGEVFNNKGEYDEALKWHKVALAIREKVFGKEHPNTVDSYYNVGIICCNLSMYDEALEWHKKALFIREKVLDGEHQETANSYHCIGIVCNNQENYHESLKWYEKALFIREKILGKEHPHTANSYHNKGIVYNNLCKYLEALKWLEKALSAREKVFGKEHPHTADSYYHKGIVHNNLCNFGESMEWHEKAVSIREKELGKEHPDTVNSYHSKGVVYNNLRNFDEALKWHKEALSVREKYWPNNIHTAISHHSIGKVYNNQGNYTQALEHYSKAYKILVELKHPNTKNVHDSMFNIYSKTYNSLLFEEWLKTRIGKSK